MANSPQAIKRARQTEKRNLRNAGQHSQVRTMMKKVLKAVQDGNKDAATAAFKIAVPLIDRLAKRNIIQANKAARIKSRLNAKIKNA